MSRFIKTKYVQTKNMIYILSFTFIEKRENNNKGKQANSYNQIQIDAGKNFNNYKKYNFFFLLTTHFFYLHS